jgi:hypothetical protein
MTSPHTKTKEIRLKLNVRSRWSRYSFVLGIVLCAVSLAGCQQLPGGQAMRQYQVESDRLLAEFRAQKKRAEDLEARNNQLEQRLAESEKQLARNLGGYAGRTNATNSNRGRSDSGLMIGDAPGTRSSSLSDANSSRSSDRGPLRIERGGLADVRPTTTGLMTGSRNDPMSLGGGTKDLRGDPKSESQWRPVNRNK